MTASPTAATLAGSLAKSSGVSRFQAVLLATLVFVVGCLAYVQTIWYDFTFDDVWAIAKRDLFHDPSRWREILGASWWLGNTLYRPVTALSVAWNWRLGGGDPHSFHLVNLLLHGVTAVLVLRLARPMLGWGAAVVAGLLFAVHPVHVEAVANVVGRAEVIATLFAVLAVLAYRADGALSDQGDHASWRRIGATFATLGFTVLALGGKESAFALPGLLLLSDVFDADQRGRPWRLEIRRHLPLWVAVLVASVGWLMLRSRMVGDLTGLETPPGMVGLGLVARLQVMAPVVFEYLRLLFFPARLSADYSPNTLLVVPEWRLPAIAGLLTVFALGAVAVLARRRAPVVMFALGWIAASLAIVANVIVPTGIVLAERTLYLPSVGAALLLGWGWTHIERRGRALAVAVLVVVVAAGAARTVTRNPVWRNNDAFFPAIVHDSPKSYRAAWTVGMLATKAKDYRAAEWHLRHALDVLPIAAPVWRDLGRLLQGEQRYAEAATAHWAAWRLDSHRLLDFQSAIYDWVSAGQVDTAEARHNEALQKVPNDRLEVKLAQAQVAMARGNPRKAMTLRRLVAWEHPEVPRIWQVTAEAALEARECGELVRSTGRLRALYPQAEQLPSLEAGIRRLGCVVTTADAAPPVRAPSARQSGDYLSGDPFAPSRSGP